MQLDVALVWKMCGLTSPGRALSRASGCPRMTVGTQECTAGQLVGLPP